MSYVDDYEARAQEFSREYAELIEGRAHAPHCDQRVLHSPGTCWACDGYPDWQWARTIQKINFTDEEDPTKGPCPARLERPLDVINRWHGNVAETREAATTASPYVSWLRRLF